MSGRFLLDTNILIALFAEEPSVLARLASAESVFVPAIALGELYYGARKSARVDANLNRLDEFAAEAVMLVCDASTARHYGRIKNDLRAKGHPIPENDIWIAAIAAQHGLTRFFPGDFFFFFPGRTVSRCRKASALAPESAPFYPYSGVFHVKRTVQGPRSRIGLHYRMARLQDGREKPQGCERLLRDA